MVRFCFVPVVTPGRASLLRLGQFRPFKIIPAVKITGVNPLPLLEDDDDDLMMLEELCPEICVSTGDIHLDSMESSLLPSLDADIIPNLLSDRDDESDLGEFLLDAVQWL
jgi:hypothetical protein